MVSMDKKDTAFRGPDLKLFVRDVRDRQGRKRAISVRSWSTIKDVKGVVQQVIQVPPGAQRLYFGPLLTSGGELPNHRTLHDAGIYRSGETLLLDIKQSVSSDSSSAFNSTYALRSAQGNDVCISSSMMDSTPRRLRSMVQDARRGFAVGLKPELVLDGSGGTYFLHDVRKNKIAVFKPADEEPYAENNPRGYLCQPGQKMSLREGIAPGEACIREVAAYLLDHDGFSGVPMTTLAEARHPALNTNGARLKVSEGGASIGSHSIAPNSPVKSASVRKAGSFQEFVRSDCTMDDLSPSMIGAEEVHKIAILDIRIMNADRNAANLLCRRREDDSIELVPIDHGYCLRSVCDSSWMDWCWLDWPQLKMVRDFTVGADSERYSMHLCDSLLLFLFHSRSATSPRNTF
jgi:Phosphatidylinositol 3- and 4-kinase